MYMSIMNTQQIMDILPHRSPFLLIDTVEELQPGVKCVAKKNVTMNEPHFMGHFPGNPVMRECLLLRLWLRPVQLLFFVRMSGRARLHILQASIMPSLSRRWFREILWS